MVTFLFWNIDGQPRQASIADLARRHSVDVLLLAESSIPPGRMQAELNAPGQEGFRQAFRGYQSLHIYTRFSARYIRDVQDSAHYTIRRLRLPLRREITLVAAHLPSQLHRNLDSMGSVCREFGRAIRDAEERIGHQATVVVGDLNVDPYDSGMLAADGLHAVMTRERAARGARTVDETSYPFFYNPMWGHFGDADGPAPGTYHYRRSEHVCRFWHMFDQVLIRPALLDCFDSTELTIITEDGTMSFLRDDGTPNRQVASDHLPVLFRLRI